MLAALESIGAGQVTDLVSRALASRRSSWVLDECVEDYHETTEVEDRLWAFVKKNQKAIQVSAIDGLEREGEEFPSTPIQKLWWALEDAGFRTKEDVPKCRERAARLAEKKKLGASTEDVDGAVHWFLFANWVDAGRLADCAKIADQSLALAGRELSDEVLNLAEQYLEEGKDAEADRWASAFVAILTRERKPLAADVESWGDFLRANSLRLPAAAAAFKNVKRPGVEGRR